MKNCYILIGLPGVGKSTFVKNHFSDYQVISSDDFIQERADAAGVTYNDAFESNIKAATLHFFDSIEKAVTAKKNIIVDRTSLTVAARKRILNMVPFREYNKRAVEFKMPESDDEIAEWKTRLNRHGKAIPDYMLSSMRKSYQPASYDEGFDHIINYNSWEK